MCYEPGMRLLWGAVLLASCVPGPHNPPEIATTTIEASSAAERHNSVEPVGEDDADAQRCFQTARVHPDAGRLDAPCSARAIGACAQRCRHGQLDACQLLGEILGDSGDSCAATLWRLACERRHLPACTSLAALHLTIDDNPEQAAKLLSDACDGAHGPACTALGDILAVDESLSDDATAISMLERGCELGDGRGCGAAGQRYVVGDGVTTDRVKGAQLLQQACTLGDGSGCMHLAQAYQYGRGVPRNEVETQRLLEHVCHVNDESAGEGCFRLGVLLASQGGSAARVKALYRRSCDNKHFEACNQVAQDHYVAGRYDDAIALGTTLITQRPNHWLPRYARGMSHFDSGHFKAAATDLAILCDARNDWPHCQLWLFAARERAGGTGRAALEHATARLDKNMWPAPVFDFFLGALSSRQLLRAADHPDGHKQLQQQCEAYYYVGQQHMIDRDSRRAAIMFNKAIATGITNFVEYGSSKAELARMAPSP